MRAPRAASGAGSSRSSVAAAGAALLLLLAAPAAPGAAQTGTTQEEALASAFPAPTVVERRTAFLTDAQLARARELAGSDAELDRGVISYYVGARDGTPVGVAYFDAHRVRTLAEVVMIVVTPAGRVDRVDILKFMEPPEYRAPAGWIQQFAGRALDDDLSMKGDILNITGATLTARALTRAVRRVLALHAVIDPFGTGAAP